MRISILCSNRDHPVNDYLNGWLSKNKLNHQIELVRKKSNLSGGDILFLVSCSEIIQDEDRSKYKKTLVLHASDLPKGRGWSPHIWEILNGAGSITLSLLEAEDKVDSGKIWKKEKINIPKDALWNEINDYLFTAEIGMMDFAVENFYEVVPFEQPPQAATYYRKRIPEDSRIDIEESISKQFDRIRVCDPNRFPAYIEIRGFKYKVILEKMERLKK